MKSFDPKGQAETLNYTVAFTKRLPAGVTITSSDVKAAVKFDSKVADGNPTDILNGPSQVNAAAAIIDGVQVGIGQAIIQSIRRGVIGCTYLLTWTATLSNGETPVVHYSLYVAAYAPER